MNAPKSKEFKVFPPLSVESNRKVDGIDEKTTLFQADEGTVADRSHDQTRDSSSEGDGSLSERTLVQANSSSPHRLFAEALSARTIVHRMEPPPGARMTGSAISARPDSMRPDSIGTDSVKMKKAAAPNAESKAAAAAQETSIGPVASQLLPSGSVAHRLFPREKMSVIAIGVAVIFIVGAAIMLLRASDEGAEADLLPVNSGRRDGSPDPDREKPPGEMARSADVLSLFDQAFIQTQADVRGAASR